MILGSSSLRIDKILTCNYEKKKLNGVVNKNAMTLFNGNDIGSNVLRLANLWPTDMRSNWNLKIAFLWYFIYLLLAKFEVHAGSLYGPSFSARFMAQAQSTRAINRVEKRGSVTYSTDRQYETNKIFIISL